MGLYETGHTLLTGRVGFSLIHLRIDFLGGQTVSVAEVR